MHIFNVKSKHLIFSLLLKGYFYYSSLKFTTYFKKLTNGFGQLFFLLKATSQKL